MHARACRRGAGRRRRPARSRSDGDVRSGGAVGVGRKAHGGGELGGLAQCSEAAAGCDTTRGIACCNTAGCNTRRCGSQPTCRAARCGAALKGSALWCLKTCAVPRVTPAELSSLRSTAAVPAQMWAKSRSRCGHSRGAVVGTVAAQMCAKSRSRCGHTPTQTWVTWPPPQRWCARVAAPAWQVPAQMWAVPAPADAAASA